MAQITPSSPIQSLSGKFSWTEKIIYRTRNGRTHAYVMHNPYKGELAESRKAAINLFAEASRLCSQEMQDPDRLAYWQEEYKKHLKVHQEPLPCLLQEPPIISHQQQLRILSHQTLQHPPRLHPRLPLPTTQIPTITSKSCPQEQNPECISQ